MFSDEEFSNLSKDVYNYDRELNRSRTKSGDINQKGKYYVLKQENDFYSTIDNNQNGLQAIAATPLDNKGNPDYSQITIAFSGTGDAKKGQYNNTFGKDSNDIEQDIEGIGKDIAKQFRHLIRNITKLQSKVSLSLVQYFIERYIRIIQMQRLMLPDIH